MDTNDTIKVAVLAAVCSISMLFMTYFCLYQEVEYKSVTNVTLVIGPEGIYPYNGSYISEDNPVLLYESEYETPMKLNSYTNITNEEQQDEPIQIKPIIESEPNTTKPVVHSEPVQPKPQEKPKPSNSNPPKKPSQEHPPITPQNFRYNVTLKYDSHLGIYQNPYFHLVTKPPPNIKTYYFTNFREFLEFYKFWQDDMISHQINTPSNCYVSSRHGLANKLIGMFNIAIITMLSGKRFELCGWPDFRTAFQFQFNVPIHIQSSNNIIQFTNGCQGWPQLKEMTIEDFENPRNKYYQTNCKMLYTLYGLPIFTQRFYEMGIDLSFNNYLGNEEYIYQSFFDLFIKPNTLTQNKITDLTRSWSNYCIFGFHVRTGDSAFSRTPKKYNWHWKVDKSIQKALSLHHQCPQNKTIKWFVSSDSYSVKKWFTKNYKNYTITYKSVIVHTGHYYKTNAKGFRDAVIELYLLSKCDYRILRYESTYSYLSSVIPAKNNIWVR